MELGADWLKRLEQPQTCVCVCVRKHARSYAEWHVMEKACSEGGGALPGDRAKKEELI